MREKLPEVELTSKPRSIRTPLGLVGKVTFQSGNKYLGTVAAYPDATPPIIDVSFEAPRDLETVTTEYRSSHDVRAKFGSNWFLKELIQNAISQQAS